MSANKNEELELENVKNTTIEELGGVNGFVQRNGKIIIIAALAVIVIVGGVMFAIRNSRENEEKAALALSRIENVYMAGDYRNALNPSDSIPTVRGEKALGLLAIVNEYGSTAAGERAALFAADAYFNLEKFNEAKTYYEKAINADADIVKVGGYAGTAACDEKNGKLKEAATNYMKAVDLIDDAMLKLRYMYFAGLCNEKAGNKDDAIKIYRNIIDLNKYGEFNNLAKAGIVRLGEEVE